MNARVLPLVLLVGLAGLACGGETKGVDLELLCSVRTVAPDTTFTVALKIHHHEGFHTYWKNPGVVGYPTEIRWTLPEGFTAGPIRWPVPEHSDMAGHPVFGYEADAVLLVDLKAPATLEGGKVNFEATASWMACAAECHPGERTFPFTLPVAGAAEPDHTAFFEQAEARIPAPLEGWSARITSEAGAAEVSLVITAPEGVEIPADLDFFSSDGQISSVPATRLEKSGDRGLRLTAPRARFSPKDAGSLPFVLVSRSPLNGRGQTFGTLAPDYP